MKRQARKWQRGYVTDKKFTPEDSNSSFKSMRKRQPAQQKNK